VWRDRHIAVPEQHRGWPAKADDAAEGMIVAPPPMWETIAVALAESEWP
jgi:hypothetical protein